MKFKNTGSSHHSVSKNDKESLKMAAKILISNRTAANPKYAQDRLKVSFDVGKPQEDVSIAFKYRTLCLGWSRS